MTDEKKSQPLGCNHPGGYEGEKDFLNVDGPEQKLAKPTLLLHSCCGPCSTAVMERLVEDYDVTVFFYNPNITDAEEYERRKLAQKQCIKAFNGDPEQKGKVVFLEGPYDPQSFYAVAEAFAEEAEGGKRCESCFKLRLIKTAETASLFNFDTFTTTLTVSPHKDYGAISAIAKKIAVSYGVGFLDMDFKKKAGFQRSIALSKKYDLYRQRYCGCEYSKPEEE